MEKYIFSRSLIIRTPLLDFESEKNYSRLLTNESFRKCIFLASRSFYHELQKKEFDYDLLTNSQQQTVKKYVNRALFRATPFGLFSSVSLIDWGKTTDAEIVLSDPCEDIKLDFRVLHTVWDRYLKERLHSKIHFETNQSFYINKIDCRYIKKEISGNLANFSVVSVEKNTMLKSIAKFCSKKRSYDELVDFIMKKSGSAIQEIEEFIRQLISEQIIIPDTAPNITGEDYGDLSERYFRKICGGGNEAYCKLLDRNEASNCSPSNLAVLSQDLDSKLAWKNDSSHFYSVSKRGLHTGSLSYSYQNIIKEGLHCLNILSAAAKNMELEQFKKAFVKKYESDEVPLLEVLDPQFGIGYGDFERLKINYGFSSMDSKSEKDAGSLLSYNEADVGTRLLSNWQQMEGKSCNFELQITEKDLEYFKKKIKNGNKLPPSISIMFRVAEDKVFLESAGGASAISLAGRFAFYKDIFRYSKEIATHEQKSNKNVIFAEIAHLCNVHIANINRRPHFYEYEIPVLTNSVAEADKQIRLDNILVSVSGDEVVLRSMKQGKTIIPRLSSAFNYTKSQLPVFRFLCDIQNQDLKTNFGLSLSALVPGLSFYPRIVYKSCVLQAAEWHLDSCQLGSFLKAEKHDAFHLFRRFREKVNLPRYFSYNIGDNFLVFDAEDEEAIDLFFKEIEKKEHIVLKEFPFLSSKTVKNACNKPLVAQYVASLLLNDETYKSQLMCQKRRYAIQEKTSDWVYFKIYCHPLSSDVILMKYLWPAIHKQISTKLVIEWFWIRYSDPDYHIRLRLKVPAKDRTTVSERFNQLLERLSSDKLVKAFQIDFYRQEISRYSPEMIEYVEAVFAASSSFVVKFLGSEKNVNYEEDALLIEAVISIRVILEAFGFQQLKQIEFCKARFDVFFKEFNRPRSLKPELESLFKRVCHAVNLLWSKKPFKNYEAIRQTIKNLTSALTHKTKYPTKEELASDIVHMHLNRLFTTDQRYFEMVCYFLLWRIVNTEEHKTNLVRKPLSF